MNTITTLIKRHPLVTFFALAYAFSWAPSLVEAHGILPLGPLLAALLVLAVTAGRVAVGDFLRRIGQWRVGLRWYALVLLLPVAVTGAAVGLNVLLGARVSTTTQMPLLADLPLTFLSILLYIGLGEEPAWRGFALPRLMAGRSALAASLLLGVLHVVWHLPLFGLEYDWQNGLPWFLGVLAFSIITAWMYNHTQGSLLLPMLMHTALNTTGQYLFNPLFNGADLVRLWWLWGSLWCVLALIVVLVTGPSLVWHGASSPDAAAAA